MENKLNRSTIIVVSIIAFSIIICTYFIALGFRYEFINNTFIFDKWTKQIHVMNGKTYGKLED